jgi:hypothetical protein
MGISLWGAIHIGSVPCARLGVSRSSVYQMTTSIGKALGEGNCVRATVGGKEAVAKPARLQTETSYKAGPVGRVSQSSQSRSQLTDQVNDELAQRKHMFLSGETCIVGMSAAVAPGSMACQKAWNRPAEAHLGNAGVSRGRSTDPRHPIETGRAER